MAYSSAEAYQDTVAANPTPMPDTAQEKYDVFVSFRGKDIRKGILSHLKREFPRKQINAFLDDKLETGDEIWPTLEKAIRGSSLWVVIFSEEYASSHWCLNELAEIIDCSEKHNRTVIPVFYNVEPMNVRYQKGSYKEAFDKHEKSKRYDLAQMQNWRNSLYKAASLSGIEYSLNSQRVEAELIQEIVKKVDLKLMRFDKHQLKSKGLIGIDKSIAHIESMLRHKPEDVRIIGIWGMPGIGKTTIAEEVFEKVRSEYDGCCFLKNVRKQIGRNGTTDLKEELFSILLEDVKAKTPNGYIEKRIGRMKVLIVLDDVNSADQPEKIFGTRSCFGPGSRIIITTRDKQVLIANDVDDNDIHEIGKLSSSDALELFSLIAFKHLEMEYYELSNRVVNYANGIPLVLKILGKLLRGKDKEVWESQLDKLKRMPTDEVHATMRSGYNDLDRKEQEIFLDVACFFHGSNMKVDYIKTLLKDPDNSVSVGLERLKDKALITISKDGDVYMDDIIKETAWEIVRQKYNKEPGSYSRLWDPKDIFEVLKNDKGTDAIRSLRVNFSAIKDLKLSPHIFDKMSKLQFLMFDDCNSKENFNVFPQGIQYLPTELRYLSWRSYHLSSLPEKFSAEKLLILDLSYSLVTRLWGGVKNLVNLKEVRLRNCENLQELPDFTKATNLELVDVTSCKQLTSVHPSIFSLRNLKLVSGDTHFSPLFFLYLNSCPEPREFSVTTEYITKLDLSWTRINAFPSSFFVHEVELKTVVLRNSAIKRLPVCTKNLTRLRNLDLNFCEELWILPELPPSLETLRAVDCKLLRIVLFPSTAAEQFRENRKKVEFWNCFTLDQRSLRGIELNAQINMIKFAYQHLSSLENNYADHYNDYNDDYCSYQAMYVYPGSSVPMWLKYKNKKTEDYIIIDRSSDPPSPQLGFIFCFIVHQDSWIISGETLEFKIIINDVENEGSEESIIIHTSVSANKFASDHVCVMYDQRCSHYLNDRAKNMPKFKICFTARLTSGAPEHFGLRWLVLKAFGVSLINTSVYHNFIQQMELCDQQNELRWPSWKHGRPKP